MPALVSGHLRGKGAHRVVLHVLGHVGVEVLGAPLRRNRELQHVAHAGWRRYHVAGRRNCPACAQALTSGRLALAGPVERISYCSLSSRPIKSNSSARWSIPDSRMQRAKIWKRLAASRSSTIAWAYSSGRVLGRSLAAMGSPLLVTYARDVTCNERAASRTMPRCVLSGKLLQAVESGVVPSPGAGRARMQ